MTIGKRMRTAATGAVAAAFGAWERAESGVAFNMVSRGFIEDPHPVANCAKKTPCTAHG